MSVRTRLARARAALVLEHPFFGALAMRLMVREDGECATVWTDGRTLGFNPGYVAGLTDEELCGVLGHEVMHLACGHHVRRGSRDRRLWNSAGDLAINWILKEAGLVLPEDHLDMPQYRGLSAEAVYGLMVRFTAGRPTKGDGPQEEEGSPGSGAGQGSGRGHQEGVRRGRGASGGRDTERREERRPMRESLAGAGWELEGPDPGGCGEVRDGASAEGGRPAPEELAEAQTQWRSAVARAAAEARGMGRLPAALDRAVRGQAEPVLDWRELLRRFVSASARSDYAWTPPSRRHAGLGIVLPSARSEELSEVVVAVDTSSSIFQAELEQFGAELSAVVEGFEARAHVLYCDAAVASVQCFCRGDLPLFLEARGGGGTDFRPAFAWVEEAGLVPSCFIYLTDMECDRYPEEPGYPVLWVRVGGCGGAPPFGEVAELPAEGGARRWGSR